MVSLTSGRRSPWWSKDSKDHVIWTRFLWSPSYAQNDQSRFWEVFQNFRIHGSTYPRSIRLGFKLIWSWTGPYEPLSRFCSVDPCQRVWTMQYGLSGLDTNTQSFSNCESYNLQYFSSLSSDNDLKIKKIISHNLD